MDVVDDTVVENSDNENYVEDGKGEETQEPQQVPVVEKKKGERKPRK